MGSRYVLVYRDRPDGRPAVEAPYDPDFVREARAMGARWDGELWVFPAGTADKADRMVRRIYGREGKPIPRTPQGYEPSKLPLKERMDSLFRLLEAQHE